MEWINDNLSYILLALLGIFFNVMDSVTTEIALGKLPEHIKGEEGNPIAAWAFKNKATSIVFEIIKQSFVIGLIGYYVYDRYTYGLIVIATLFGLVVASNTTSIIMRLITKKKQKSPLFKLVSILRIPKRLSYPFIVVLLMVIAIFVASIFVDG